MSDYKSVRTVKNLGRGKAAGENPCQLGIYNISPVGTAECESSFLSVAPDGANYIEYHLKTGVLRNVENSFNALWAPRTALASDFRFEMFSSTSWFAPPPAYYLPSPDGLHSKLNILKNI